jgi:hypothetical protein
MLAGETLQNHRMHCYLLGLQAVDTTRHP